MIESIIIWGDYMAYNLRKALAFLFILGMGFSLIGTVFAQSGQIHVSSYGTWPEHYPYYYYYPSYSYWTGHYPYYSYDPYFPYYHPYYENGVEMRPGEAAAEWLFYHGIGEPWIGGDPPHSRWRY
jgi:hypothetical protein